MRPDATPPGGWPGHHPLPRERDGTSPLERLAVERMRVDVASMPASDVVQLALWPGTVAGWARDVGVASAVAYNMLSRFKPYRRVRALIAQRLDVPTLVLDHLVDAPRPLPVDLRIGSVPPTQTIAEPGPTAPTIRLPARRDGSNPIERRAAWHVAQEIAALPASVVVQLALYPETLAEWARRRSVGPSMVYGMLAGTQPQPGLREALARRLDVATPILSALLDAPRREPRRPAIVPLADAIVADAPEASDAPSPPPRDGDRSEPPPDQLTLGL